jgi:tetratricopeptide (TPR) repeat protein
MNSSRRVTPPNEMLRLSLILFVLVPIVVPAQTTVSAATAPSTRGVAHDSLQVVQDSILAAAAALVANDSSAVDEFEKIAMIYKQRKRFAAQLQVASEMARTNPQSALARLVHGDALLDNDQPEHAISELHEALRIQPNYVRARVMLAETYEILHQPDSALVHLDTALQHNPRHAQAHLQAAKLLMRRGRSYEATEHYRRACELLPDAPSSFGPWMKYADALMATAAYDQAIEALRYCMRLQPTSADAALLHAEAQEKAGHVDAAIEGYRDFTRRFMSDDRVLDAERAVIRLRYPQTRDATPPPAPPR